ncbi:MAG: 2-C-methyl-D-erythritol 4-phosphate cytidylyltransferase [Thermodesulfobacteriota bacterium]
MKSLTAKNRAVILASGSGSRINRDIPKQFLELSGSPLIIHTLKPFEKNSNIDEVIVVTLSEYIDKTWEFVNRCRLTKVKKIIRGGKTRQESSKNGIDACGDDTTFVLIHDSVRPFITNNLLNRLLKALNQHHAVIPVIPSTDTIIETDRKGFISNVPNRSKLWRVQTPQAFSYELIKKAHAKALEDGIKNSTDDSSLILRIGQPVYTIKGDEKNIKITYPTDFEIAGKLF